MSKGLWPSFYNLHQSIEVATVESVMNTLWGYRSAFAMRHIWEHLGNKGHVHQSLNTQQSLALKYCSITSQSLLWIETEVQVITASKIATRGAVQRDVFTCSEYKRIANRESLYSVLSLHRTENIKVNNQPDSSLRKCSRKSWRND